MLNVLAVAGFVTFWAKCNTRTVRATGPESPVDGKRPRVNGTAQGPGISHEVLLKRLSSLEDVVYRQLNGKVQRDIWSGQRQQYILMGIERRVKSVLGLLLDLRSAVTRLGSI